MFNTNKRLALLIGIDDYGWTGGRLYGCVNDASQLSTMLSSDYKDRPNFNCKLLTSDKQKITRSVLRKEIDNLFSQEADIVLFYFSGHGVENKNGGMLVTQDATKFDEGVALNELVNAANQASNVKEIFIILDCCHSGHAGNSVVVNHNTVLRSGLSILTASLPNQFSMEVNGNGLFTQIILDGLNGGAADTLGVVTAASLYNYAEKILDFWQQRPVFKAHCSEITPLRLTRPRLTRKELYKLIKYFKTEDFKYPLDKSYEPTEEPKSKRNEKIFSYLQKFTSAGLVQPIGAKHMYFAVMKNKCCELTPTGKFYWKLVKNRKI